MSSRIFAAALLAASILTAAAQMPDRPLTRPRITGISHIAVYTSDAAAADHYYREIIGAVKMADPETPWGVKYALSATQFIEVLPLPADAGINRLDHTAWSTDDAETLRKWLRQADIDSGTKPGTSSDDAKRIAELEREVRDLRRANDILKSASVFFATELDGRPKK